DELKIPLYRRLPGVAKPLAILSEGNVVFELKNASVCNAVPSTKGELIKVGFSVLGLEGWQKFHLQVQQHLDGSVNEYVGTKEQLKNTLINGDNNMVLIIAHSDGMRMFVGDEEITLDELNSWPSKANVSANPRIGALLICEAGKEDIKRGLLFKKRMA